MTMLATQEMFLEGHTWPAGATGLTFTLIDVVYWYPQWVPSGSLCHRAICAYRAKALRQRSILRVPELTFSCLLLVENYLYRSAHEMCVFQPKPNV